MNLFDMNTNTITMNIDGKDIEMKPAICYGKVYDKWLVSECGKVWSIGNNRFLRGSIRDGYSIYDITTSVNAPLWEDGSGNLRTWNGGSWISRGILGHKMIMDTWAPLYDNPPEGIVWEEWEIVRKLPSVFNHISKTVVIDHIDDVKRNNHLDNLRRSNQWDNNPGRKTKGI